VSALATHPAVAPHRIADRISPELELLLACACRRMSQDRSQCALGLVDSLDWSVLLELAREHRLFPLLYWHWTKSLQLSLPAGLASQLDDRFRANAARSLLLAQELAEVVERLGRRGIPAVPFKGPALAECLYGNAALRQCVDLDILIRRRDVANAIQTLLSAGYGDGKQLTAVQQTAYIDTQYEYPLLSPTGLLVELQWRIVPRYFSLPLDEEQYWSRIQPLTLCGRQMHSLSPEDLLLFLCIHGGKHGWQKLIWLADVAELVSPRCWTGNTFLTRRGALALYAWFCSACFLPAGCWESRFPRRPNLRWRATAGWSVSPKFWSVILSPGDNQPT